MKFKAEIPIPSTLSPRAVCLLDEQDRLWFRNDTHSKPYLASRRVAQTLVAAEAMLNAGATHRVVLGEVEVSLAKRPTP